MLTRRELLAGFATVAFFPLAKGESQTMEQRISIVTLGVKDLARSKRFYVDGFGWKPAFENKEIVFFQTGGMIFALFLRDHLAADFQVDLQRGDWRPTVAWSFAKAHRKRPDHSFRNPSGDTILGLLGLCFRTMMTRKELSTIPKAYLIRSAFTSWMQDKRHCRTGRQS